MHNKTFTLMLTNALSMASFYNKQTSALEVDSLSIKCAAAHANHCEHTANANVVLAEYYLTEMTMWIIVQHAVIVLSDEYRPSNFIEDTAILLESSWELMCHPEYSASVLGNASLSFSDVDDIRSLYAVILTLYTDANVSMDKALMLTRTVNAVYFSTGLANPDHINEEEIILAATDWITLLTHGPISA